jgi:hypothetical protein
LVPRGHLEVAFLVLGIAGGLAHSSNCRWEAPAAGTGSAAWQTAEAAFGRAVGCRRGSHQDLHCSAIPEKRLADRDQHAAAVERVAVEPAVAEPAVAEPAVAEPAVLAESAVAYAAAAGSQTAGVAAVHDEAVHVGDDPVAAFAAVVVDAIAAALAVVAIVAGGPAAAEGAEAVHDETVHAVVDSLVDSVAGSVVGSVGAAVIESSAHSNPRHGPELLHPKLEKRVSTCI